jgi:hypothetical protein
LLVTPSNRCESDEVWHRSRVSSRFFQSPETCTVTIAQDPIRPCNRMGDIVNGGAQRVLALNERSGISLRRKSKAIHMDGPKVPKMAYGGEVAPRSRTRNPKKLHCGPWR